MAKKDRKPAKPPPPPPDESDGGSSGSDSDGERSYERAARDWRRLGARDAALAAEGADGTLAFARDLAVDDLSSDDEEAGNATGRVPRHWYEGYDHVGYDLDGSRVVAEAPRGALDLALEADGDGAMTVYDALNGRNVVISARELEQIRRLKGGAFANPESEMYTPYLDVASSKVEQMPLSAAPEPKRRFLPSKWEGMRVHRLAKGLAEGRLRTRAENKALRAAARDPEALFLAAAASMWADDDQVEDPTGRRKGPLPVPAPKLALPGHAESYRPPPEFCVDDAGDQLEEPEDEADGFVPRQHGCLRRVGAYEHAVKERFERCLDLYLCPRALKRRLDIDPETLVPKLPDPKDLKPFPNAHSRDFVGHEAAVVALDCSGDGQWLATADAAGGVRVWEVATGRCVWATARLAGPHAALAWNPAAEHHVLAVAGAGGLYLVASGTARGDDADATAALLAGVDEDVEGGGADDDDSDADEDEDGDDSSDEEDAEDAADAAPPAQRRDAAEVAKWSSLAVDGRAAARAQLAAPARTCAWHRGGDYVVTVSPDAIASMQVIVHRCSRRASQAPLKRGDKGGQVQAAAFHPSKPFLFVASRTAVRVYHLAKRELVRTLRSGATWISCLAVHPGGDHVVAGSRDRRLCWFDLDAGERAWKTLKYHDKPLRSAAFSRKYPLLATAADDGRLHVFHAKVSDDLAAPPVVVPVKVLEAHVPADGLGALCCAFHPTQPWLFSAGGDHGVRLWQAL